MKEINFEWYVLNGANHFSSKDLECRIKSFNIFDSSYVYEETIKLCKKYKKDKMSFNDFVNQLDKIIQYQMWSRCEYEICVADWPTVYRGKDNKVISVYYGEEHEPIESIDMWKIDCYSQAHMNIKLIAKYVLETYYPRLKINLSDEKVEVDNTWAI